MNSKQLVYSALEFKNPSRIPRQLWALPWAQIYHEKELREIRKAFPDDFINMDSGIKNPPKTKGSQYEEGEYVDEWGAMFVNKQRGLIGEVRVPLIKADDWSDANRVHIPEELLKIDTDFINKQCENTDKFIFAGCCPRPFEQLQFLRGSQNLYMDLALKPNKMISFIEKMHDYYISLLTAWAKTDVDALNIMDDWGSQKSLLISPKMWREIFRPMYRDYIDIAKKYNKKIFMHSDGYTLQIISDLVDLGLDAFNTQIFCMDFKDLTQFAGKITFWGEIDRQHLLVHGSEQDIRDAVNKAFDYLYKNGGVIGQCEFGAGANPKNVYTVFDQWNKVL